MLTLHSIKPCSDATSPSSLTQSQLQLLKTTLKNLLTTIFQVKMLLKLRKLLKVMWVMDPCPAAPLPSATIRFIRARPQWVWTLWTLQMLGASVVDLELPRASRHNWFRQGIQIMLLLHQTMWHHHLRAKSCHRLLYKHHQNRLTCRIQFPCLQLYLN